MSSKQDASIRKPDFTAVTANIHYSAKAGEVRELVTHLRDEEEASMIFGQEFPRPEQRAVLTSLGYLTFFHPRQFVVAILPDIWTCSRARGYDLGPEYGVGNSKEGGDRQRTGVSMGVFVHRQRDRTLKAYSAHPPSGVQVRGGVSKDAPKRVEALKFLVDHLQDKCENRHTDAFLVGLDDNVDETRAPGEWDFMPPSRGRAGVLKQKQPPVGSHGQREERGRKIDPFYFDGLTAIGTGDVLWDLATGDHGPHVQSWAFNPKKR